ncbi:MAG: hypothetical protein FJY95_11965 [Candidatus Handelsmanbacteria bacterium]|nr:hypothetical protein [Candidatus Handelsmanbacteria bacterium]
MDGHRDQKTTLGYARVSPDHEKAAIQRLRYKSNHQVDTKSGNAYQKCFAFWGKKEEDRTEAIQRNPLSFSDLQLWRERVGIEPT